jgi:hypothetical protein
VGESKLSVMVVDCFEDEFLDFLMYDALTSL